MIDRTTAVAALRELSAELERRGVMGEIDIVGGTAMMLAFRAREATKDVDGVFEPVQAIREAARAVAARLDLPSDWLNDAAKGFLSANGEFLPIPSLDLPNLRVLAPTPEYMLAMKVLAARAGTGADRGDIEFLIRLLALRSASEVMAIAQKYYDPSRLLPRSYYLVDEIMEQMDVAG